MVQYTTEAASVKGFNVPKAGHARWVHAARRIALRSPHPKHRMAALVLAGGRILASATNRGPHSGHAEAVALRGYETGRFKGATIVVVRVLGEGVGMSRPCLRCEQLIRRSRIANMVYIWWDGKTYTEEV